MRTLVKAAYRVRVKHPVVMSFLFKIVIVQCVWWGQAILNTHHSRRYRYPVSDLRDYRSHNMHWGVLVGLVKVLRHL